MCIHTYIKRVFKMNFLLKFMMACVITVSPTENIFTNFKPNVLLKYDELFLCTQRIAFFTSSTFFFKKGRFQCLPNCF